MQNIELKIKKLHPDAIIPQYASEGSACFDLHALCEGYLRAGMRSFVFPTGLAFEVPQGFVLKVYSRSGQGFGHDVRLANAVGVIDADYRGDVMVKLTLDNSQGFMHIRKGDRIAQAMLEPAPRVRFIEADKLTDTARGAGGFGSTGQ